ncbi:MAG: hypothetical protein RLN81_03500 [Balneolaceae bacterium]
MSNKLDDITLYYYPKGDDAKKFTMKQNVISDLYVQYLNGYKPPRTSRISVELSNEDFLRNYSGSILTVNAKFDKEKYWELSSIEQNQYILDTTHRIALLCANEYQWDKDIFSQAYEKVKKANFKYEIEGKKKSSSDRKHKAAVLLMKNESYSTISVAFYDKSGKPIKTIELIKSFQHEMFYGSIIKKHKWFNNREFGLYTTNEELTIRASLDTDLSETSLNPKKSSIKELEGYLRRITYREFNDQKDIIEWMNK